MFRKNILYTSVVAYAVQGCGFINAIVISRYIDAADYGIYALVLSILMSVDKVLEFGITQWVVKLRRDEGFAGILVAAKKTSQNYYLVFGVSMLAYLLFGRMYDILFYWLLLSTLLLLKGMRLKSLLILKHNEKHAYLSLVSLGSNIAFYSIAISGMLIFRSFYPLIFGQIVKALAEFLFTFFKGESLTAKTKLGGTDVLSKGYEYRFGVFKSDIVGFARGVATPIAISVVFGSEGYGIVAYSKKIGEMIMVATRSVGQIFLQKMARDRGIKDSKISKLVFIANCSLAMFVILVLSIGKSSGIVNPSWNNIVPITALFLFIYLVESLNFIHTQRLKTESTLSRYLGLVYTQFIVEFLLLLTLHLMLGIYVVPFSMFFSAFVFSVYFFYRDIYDLLEKVIISFLVLGFLVLLTTL